MKKSLGILVILFLLMGQIFLLDYTIFLPHKNIASVERGNIDLSELEFSQGGIINLNETEWEFYDGQFLTAEDFKTLKDEKPKLTGYVKLLPPGTNNIMAKARSSKGIGTYRLTIKLKPSGQMFALKMQNIRVSTSMYINGIPSGSSGKAAPRDEGYSPGDLSYISCFNIQGDRAEVIIQTANF